MNLLALDTSSLACSVALQIDDATFQEHEEQAREHTRLLVPMIRSLLDEAGVGPEELDAIVLGNGPGSFIGVRIAASVAQGIAFAAGIEIVPISSMAAVAAQALKEHDAEEIVVTQDAHMNEIYLGIYRRDTATGLPDARSDERLHGRAPIVDLDPDVAVDRIAAGFGWQRYPDLLQANRERFREYVEIWHPRAAYLLGLGAEGLAAGSAVGPECVVPAYLRQQVARAPGAEQS